MSTVQLPQVGSPLWFLPKGDDERRFVRRDAQPILATVIYAANERDVVVKITDHDGNESIRRSVVLRQDGDAEPEHSHCVWPSFVRPAVEPPAVKPTPQPEPEAPAEQPAFEAIENVATDVIDATSTPLSGETPPEVLTALGTTTRKKR